MSTQLIALLIVLALAIGALFAAWFAIAACILSGDIAESERQAEALKAMGWQEWPTNSNDPVEDNNA